MVFEMRERGRYNRVGDWWDVAYRRAFKKVLADWLEPHPYPSLARRFFPCDARHTLTLITHTGSFTRVLPGSIA